MTKTGEPQSLGGNHLLFSEGDMGDAAFLLLAGKVKLWRGKEDNPSFQHVFQGNPKRPQLIGKPALMGETHEVSARTASAVKLVPIARAAFTGVLAKADPLVRMMLVALLHDIMLMQSEK